MKKPIFITAILFLLIIVFNYSCQKENNPPSIQEITASPQEVTIGETAQLNCTAIDADGDMLIYSWSANAGSFVGTTTANSVTWKAPDVAGNYSITVSVSDGKSATEQSKSINVIVPPAEVTGFVYFSGTTIPVSGVNVKIGALQSTTSSDGKFSIKANMGNQQVQANKDGFDTYTKNINIANTTNQIIIELTSGTYTSKVYGTVKNEKGQPVSGIPVVLLNPDEKESNLKTTTDAAGYYQLPSVPQGTRILLFKQVNPYGENKASLFISNTDYPYSIILVDLSPVVDFTASLTSTTVGQSIQFTDKSTNSPTSWLWNFGDGTTSTSQNPTKVYNTAGTYSVSLKATNSFGNNTKTLTNYITVTESSGGTGETGTLTYYGRTYKTVIINGKEWMAENLAYLPSVSPSSQGSATAPHYYVYGYQGSDVVAAKQRANYITYGVLYNWAAAKAACPPGWHLPTDAEWTALTTFLGGEAVAGGKMKETGTAHWNSPNTGATNETGFSALPGGTRGGNTGTFLGDGSDGFWWSSTESGSSNAWFRNLYYILANVYRSSGLKANGFSVRCVRD